MSEPKDDIDEFLYGNAEKDEVTDQVENEEEEEESSEDDFEIVTEDPTASKKEKEITAIPTSMVMADVNKSAQIGIQLDVTGNYEGENLFDLELDGMEDKPWRKPGADITDYFNYGFNENTWNMYAQKQKKIRDEYSGIDTRKETRSERRRSSEIRSRSRDRKQRSRRRSRSRSPRRRRY